MRRALTLATESVGLASPNPQVGCVLTQADPVLGERIIGEGAHRFDEFDHAEVVALKQAHAAGHATAGATAYVTLEPCSHHGRTGPCADALIAAGITRCVLATEDPNPQVAGRGIARLRAAGIEVEIGQGQAEARTLNNAFALSITRGRPFVTLKAALSADGMLAPPPAMRPAVAAPFWLTGAVARAEVQHLRHAADAILTGIGTVLADDPVLTDRTGLPRRRPLLRALLDRHLRLPLASQLARTPAGLHLFCDPDTPSSARDAFAAHGMQVTAVSTLAEILQHLHQANILHVLLEAGPTLNAAFLAADLVDGVILHYAETELGPAALPFAAGGPTPFALEQRFLPVNKRSLGPDLEVAGLLHDPWPPAAKID